MDETWAQSMQQDQYAQYLAYAGLTPAPTMSAGGYYDTQIDNQYPQLMSAVEADFIPPHMNHFASYLPYMSYADGQADDAETIITNPFTPSFAPLEMAQAVESHTDHYSDSEPDLELDENITQELLYAALKPLNLHRLTSPRSFMPLADLQNAHIGVEAVFYLQRMLDNGSAYEPLHAALGGDPFALKHHLENELNLWKKNNITPLFVFEGQSTVGKEEVAFRHAREALGRTQTAWETYTDNQPDAAVKQFGKSGELTCTLIYTR